LASNLPEVAKQMKVAEQRFSTNLKLWVFDKELIECIWDYNFHHPKLHKNCRHIRDVASDYIYSTKEVVDCTWQLVEDSEANEFCKLFFVALCLNRATAMD